MDCPDASSLLADMYIDSQIGRLLHMRNYWLQRMGRPVTYHGPQAYLHVKRSALRTAKAIHKLFGPYALTTDGDVGLDDGHVEVQQRGSIVAQHPGRHCRDSEGDNGAASWHWARRTAKVR